MASSSRSEPLADHKEEEEAKKLEKKQFPSQTRYIPFLVLAIVVVMSLAMGIIWAVVKPKRPQVVAVNGYIVQGTRKISRDNTSLNGTFYFDFRFYNPNKKAIIYYDTLNATSSFSDKTQKLGNLNGSFPLKPRDQMPVNYTFTAEFWSIYIFMPKYLSQGRVTLSVLFKAKIRFEVAGWKSLPRTINIDCSPLVVFDNDKNPRAPTFKPTACKVDY
ncbi:hypothetical protein FEM48_Zijuj02G0035700 [Ziziphus jujuba var. spinosa]|uniref:Late embryogenesis abundant protein LEA-2 subgroup domain-containing protein n=1 Tax=Ziziphus jujuba var. spinosa TaxID=714518 RepID=A0A978VTD8_ZIZJJ|nr:uncharacterized protein LOC107410560 [Ziziphus jujuba var. spinosa]KAH7542083.1 hypothetical protein FEM48_Zijuj02G0035700 [Ziziphus jujuba var. spinosa]